MNPQTSRRIRRALAALALVLVIASGYAFFNAGLFLTRQDALQKADAIFVLAGSSMQRPLEAADLYREGWAPLIVLTYGVQDYAVEILRERGTEIPLDEEFARMVLMEAGIPADAFLMPSRFHDNTAQEAQTLRQLALGHDWHRVIVVSSRYHLRRAGFAMRRELAGTGVEVVMRGSRYDPVAPERWWRSRADIRWMLSEAPKLLAYMLGLGA